MTSTSVEALPAVPIAEGLFTSAGEDGRLITSRCAHCRHVEFPQKAACPGCGSAEVERHLLARDGFLWTWTVQNFRPKPPYALPEDEDFEPYGVGYVEIPGEARVEARLTVADVDRLRIGMPMTLTFIPLWVKDGRQVVTFAFAPSDEVAL